MSDAFDVNTKNLDQIIKALKSNMSRARVGILGGKTARNPVPGEAGVNTNASIGAEHEFGGKFPQRSFLRVPISENMQKEMDNSGAFDKDALAMVLKEGSPTAWLRKVAIIAERIVAEAFETGGFGRWKPSNMLRKKNHQTLVETQQLRNSITSEVK